MKKTRLICGDYWHAAAPYDPILKRVARETGMEVETIFHPAAFSDEWLEGVDALIWCKEGVVPGTHHQEKPDLWMTWEDEEQVARWVSEGGYLIGWHSGVAGNHRGGPLQDLFGGRFAGHPPLHAFQLKVTRTDHPMAEGVSDFEALDELYRFDLNDDFAGSIFMEGSSEQGGVQPVAWTRERGDGKVACYLLGHSGYTLGQASSLRLLRNLLQQA